MPARRYEGEVPSFEVAAGKLTDAGEFILEARPDAPISEEAALKFLMRDHRAFEMRAPGCNRRRRCALCVPKLRQRLRIRPGIGVSSA